MNLCDSIPSGPGNGMHVGRLSIYRGQWIVSREILTVISTVYDGEANHDREADQILGITASDVLDLCPHQFRSKSHGNLAYAS